MIMSTSWIKALVISALFEILGTSGTVNRFVVGVLRPVTPNHSPSVITRAISFIPQSSRKILRRMCLIKSFRGLIEDIPAFLSRYVGLGLFHRLGDVAARFDDRYLHRIQEKSTKLRCVEVAIDLARLDISYRTGFLRYDQ